ncbi:PAS domain S-box protein [Haloarcula sp. 1CSR25-25]|uniref:PAS domain S-box protein n=1 Tax=Haloarcula sp. 1CSR25-25 TaxID=2862545 RepID=UPI0028A004EC|nr:PAS domain S-box protein [Haloarcula sp. 1CSR25-25]
MDDKSDFADMVATFLERTSDRITVETATSASEALERLTDEDFDCIVSDYDMPSQDGIEFLKTVRKDDPDLPFILYTGKGCEEVASDAVSAGATDYLQKESGTDQYTILANRIRNVVQQYRASQRAAELDRVRTLRSNVNQALVRAESRSDAETRVCEILSEANPYHFAWIGEVHSSTDAITPRASAGIDEGYLEEITVTADGTDTGQGPGGTAARERRVTVTQNVQDGPNFDPWREHALKRGFQAVAALPLEYDDTLYGILSVYANRPHAFDATERDLLTEIGDDIAHAIHSLEIQEQLREEHKALERYETIIEASGDPVYTLDSEGKFMFVNDALTELTGYKESELLGEHISIIMNEDDIITGETMIKELVRSDEQSRDTFEMDLVSADGDQLVCEAHIALLPFDEEFRGTTGIIRDISERTERKRKLEETNAVLSTLFKTLPVGVLAEDASRNVLAVNRRLFELFEFPGTPADAIGMNCEQLTVQASDMFVNTDEFVGHINELVAERKPTDNEEFSLTDSRMLEQSYRPIELPDGGGHLWTYRDVTEQTEHERELEQRTAELAELTSQLEDQYRYLFEEAPVMIVETRAADEEPIIEDCNQLFVQTLGYDTEDILEQPLAAFYTDDSRRQLLEDGGYERALSGEFMREDRKLVAADGKPVETLLRAVPRYDATDTIIGTIAFYIDISERKELKRERNRLEEFASIVSHDLRNPLNVAQGRVELARKECENEHLDAITRAHERMGTLIDDLLTLARQGGEVTDTEAIDLATLTETCWGTVATTEATLTTDVTRTIYADKGRLKQLLENLMRNAIEHGGEGVTVTVGEGDDGFYVEDTGPGIHEDTRETVFEIGYSTAEDGTGFGLHIVEQVADAHGWDICVTDGSESGARFEFTDVEFAAE